MATKTISITEKAYFNLAGARTRENESFSEVINRKFEKKVNIMDYFGSLSKKSADRLEENIKKIRKAHKKADKDRAKRIKEMFN